MMRVAIIAAAALVMTGCSTTPRTDDDRFTVKDVGGARCVIYKPGSGTVSGTQMECDFTDFRLWRDRETLEGLR